MLAVGVPFKRYDKPPTPEVAVSVGVAVGVTAPGVGVMVGVIVGVARPVAVAVGVTRPVRVTVPVAVAARVEVLVGVTRPVAVPVAVRTMPVGVLVRVAVTVALGPTVPPQKSNDMAARGAPQTGSASFVPSFRATSASSFHAPSTKHCVYLAPKSLYFLLPTPTP
jgi:hypothetical protein